MDFARAYTERALARAAALGGKICVFGGGRSRNIGEDVDRSFAEKRFADMLEFCAEQADRHGLTLALEPLNTSETNHINTVAEAATLVRSINKQNLRALVDFYHFFMENEPDANVINAKDVLLHAHLARPNADRMAPRAGDEETITHWAELLKQIDYQGAIALECRYGDEFEKLLTEATPLMQAFRN